MDVTQLSIVAAAFLTAGVIQGPRQTEQVIGAVRVHQETGAERLDCGFAAPQGGAA